MYPLRGTCPRGVSIGCPFQLLLNEYDEEGVKCLSCSPLSPREYAAIHCNGTGMGVHVIRCSPARRCREELSAGSPLRTHHQSSSFRCLLVEHFFRIYFFTSTTSVSGDLGCVLNPGRNRGARELPFGRLVPKTDSRFTLSWSDHRMVHLRTNTNTSSASNETKKQPSTQIHRRTTNGSMCNGE